MSNMRRDCAARATAKLMVIYGIVTFIVVAVAGLVWLMQHAPWWSWALIVLATCTAAVWYTFYLEAKRRWPRV